MQMLYNSDSYVVVQYSVEQDVGSDAPARGGYEIVDKLARKEIYLQGAVADFFKRGVEALVQQEPSEEKFDEFIAGFTGLAHQPVALH